mmetsp:Transcript_63051/g.124670  ORF Transcript_63051/g.124670 Transcript_63051/m.124670 type:complete len:213 (+) Transcript_63051:831-1469(+)
MINTRFARIVRPTSMSNLADFNQRIHQRSPPSRAASCSFSSFSACSKAANSCSTSVTRHFDLVTKWCKAVGTSGPVAKASTSPTLLHDVSLAASCSWCKTSLATAGAPLHASSTCSLKYSFTTSSEAVLFPPASRLSFACAVSGMGEMLALKLEVVLVDSSCCLCCNPLSLCSKGTIATCSFSHCVSISILKRRCAPSRALTSCSISLHLSR